ncbi:dirigent protein 4-like [Aristolochia californica]|uniref:dirigent protein 4-like n=1 Tax=Aristolochia californica TaxID=171875 RepID=UPI0035D89ED9
MAGKLSFVVALLLCTSLMLSPVFSSPFGQEKVTHLHFYLNDIISGKEPTAVLVAKADSPTGPSTTPFGNVYATDDLLTDEPGGNVIGNAQGLWVSSGKEELSLVLLMDFGFTSGPYNGSSISIFSRNQVLQETRALAVVGGRGQFRLARGFAELRTYYLNNTNGDAIIEYKVTVLHY